jgi:hypothetical protein
MRRTKIVKQKKKNWPSVKTKKKKKETQYQIEIFVYICEIWFDIFINNGNKKGVKKVSIEKQINFIWNNLLKKDGIKEEKG